MPFSSTTNDAVLRFNGGLFQERAALPLKPELLGLLIDAAKADWRDVEPAIFGTFLEQALDPRERRKLGAEFTPSSAICVSSTRPAAPAISSMSQWSI